MRALAKRRRILNKYWYAWLRTKNVTVVFPMSEGKKSKYEYSDYLIYRKWFDNPELLHEVGGGSTFEASHVKFMYSFATDEPFLWVDVTAYDRDMSAFVEQLKGYNIPVGVRVKDGNDMFYQNYPVWLTVASTKQTFMQRPYLFARNVRLVETLDGDFIDVGLDV